MTPFRQRMIDAMVLRGFAQRTQWTCVTAVKQLGRYPPKLGRQLKWHKF